MAETIEVEVGDAYAEMYRDLIDRTTDGSEALRVQIENLLHQKNQEFERQLEQQFEHASGLQDMMSEDVTGTTEQSDTEDENTVNASGT